MIRTPGAGRGGDSSACLFAVSDRFEPAVNPLEDSVTLSGVSGAAMEEWRQCGRWLIDCKVLPPNHRVVWPSAAVFDLAQALRDGVLLCQMLHNLSPGSVDLKEINFRPQMSQRLPLVHLPLFAWLPSSAPGAADFHDYKAGERSGWHTLIRPLIPRSPVPLCGSAARVEGGVL
ncbi:hypothetical protein JOQ06_008313, partial [Pogonophryne albipinna]